MELFKLNDDVEFAQEASPLSHSLNGHFFANNEVLDQLDKDRQSLPGFFSFLILGVVGYAVAYGAFGSHNISAFLALLVWVVARFDADRRKDAIAARYREELQNGIIRAAYAQAQEANLKLRRLMERQ